MKNNLQTEFGNIDIYLFDQLLKGRFDDCNKIIDVGCGSGRNIIYFLKNGYEVHGIDIDWQAVATVQNLCRKLAPENAVENFSVCEAENLSYHDSSFDLVICSAVLHFAKNTKHFDEMIKSIWRVLKSGGYLFARLASDIGIESLVASKDNGQYLLPDSSIRFLVNEKMLIDYTNDFNAELYEPIKTTNVNNLRCMTTWCLRKR